MTSCPDERMRAPVLNLQEHPMAFGLFRKRCRRTGCACRPKPRLRRLRAATDAIRRPRAIRPGQSSSCWNSNSARMIRQLERAANSVAGGAEATAATLSTIRQRTDALTGRTSAAQSTATTFSQAADKFTQSAQGIGAQVRDAGKLADQAGAAAQRSPRQCRSPARVLGGDRQCRQSDRADRAADHAAGAQLHHRGRARRRGRQGLCGGRHRGQGAGGADPERDRRDHQEDRGAAARRRGLGRRRASHLAGDRGDPPGVRERQRRGRRAERDHRRNVRQCGVRLQFIASVGDSAAEIDSATKAGRGAWRKRRQGRPAPSPRSRRS